MKEKLPNLYRGSIEKKLRNSMDAYYSFYENKKGQFQKAANELKNKFNFEINVKKKIYNIFKENKFNYLIKSEITMNDGTIITRDIIGQNHIYLITRDNEKIIIDNIKDIKTI